jgi:hypothetical protein
MSTINVGISAAAKQADRLMAVVVFPTPPFWLEIAMIFPISSYSERKDEMKAKWPTKIITTEKASKSAGWRFTWNRRIRKDLEG